MTERVWIELIQSITLMLVFLTLIAAGLCIYWNETKGGRK